jgi:hypothetical protein
MTTHAALIRTLLLLALGPAGAMAKIRIRELRGTCTRFLGHKACRRTLPSA